MKAPVTSTVAQRQNTVSAYFTSKDILPFAFVEQSSTYPGLGASLSEQLPHHIYHEIGLFNVVCFVMCPTFRIAICSR